MPMGHARSGRQFKAADGRCRGDREGWAILPARPVVGDFLCLRDLQTKKTRVFCVTGVTFTIGMQPAGTEFEPVGTEAASVVAVVREME